MNIVNLVNFGLGYQSDWLSAFWFGQLTRGPHPRDVLVPPSRSVTNGGAGGEIVPLDFPSNGAIVVVLVPAIGDDLNSAACNPFLELGTLVGDMQ